MQSTMDVNIKTEICLVTSLANFSSSEWAKNVIGIATMGFFKAFVHSFMQMAFQATDYGGKACICVNAKNTSSREKL